MIIIQSDKVLKGLTENISYCRRPQGGKEGGNEGILEERHVLKLTGLVKRGNCREQVGEEIHL